MNIKQKYLLVLLIALFIASATSAFASVTITPAAPVDSNDLTCYYNGAVCSAANGCTAKWTSTGFSGEKIVNPLSNIFTTAGTTVTCNAWKATPPIGSIFVGSASVLIGQNPPPNTPPNILNRIPDYGILENSGLNDNLVPLWNYASDAQTPTNQLVFTITQQTNPTAVNCVIDDQSARAINPGVFVDCTTQLNQIGYSDITVRVTDADGLFAEDVFRVTVIGINNPPTLLFLPDITIAEDSGLNTQLIDLWNYGSDVETPDEQLVFRITSESGLSITDCSVKDNRYIECLTLSNQNGISDVSVQVQDATGLTAFDIFRVTVTPVNDIPIVSNIPDVTMYEDLPNSADPLIDLDLFGSDPDGDAITWSAVSSTPNLGVVINPGNTVSYTLAANWFGSATIIFTASDGSLTASDTISVIVYPVNDAPTIDGLINQTFLEDFGTADNIINLWNFASDIETPDNQLIFNIISESAPGIVDCHVDSNRYIDCVSQLNQNGSSDITIEVRDPIGLTDTAVFRITVTPVNDAPVITPIVNVEFDEDSSTTRNLDLYVSDVDNNNNELVWSVLASTNIIININPITHVANFSANTNWNGEETITLQVCDPSMLCDTDDILIVVNPVPDAPVATITNPLVGLSFACGAPISLEGTFTDPDLAIEGDSISLAWQSSINGLLGTGTPLIVSNLACNRDHIITLTATDSYGQIDTDTRIIHVDANIPPSVIINTPLAGQQFNHACQNITFDATITDADGTITNTIWSLNGNQLSNSATFSIPANTFSVGMNTITLTAIDNYGDATLRSITFEVVAHTPAIVSIINPSNTGSYTAHFGASVPFSASVTPTDVCGSANVNDYVWRWDDAFDGSQLATNYSFSTDDLDLGLHKITAYATDKYGAFNLASINVNITNTNPIINSITCYNKNNPASLIIELEPIYCVGGASDPDGDAITTWIWNVVEDSAPETILYEGTSSTFNLPQLLKNGTYTATAIVEDDIGAFSSLFNAPIIVQNNPPIVTLVANTTSGNEPLSVGFRCNVANGNPNYIFNFNFQTGSTTTDSSYVDAVYTYSQQGTYTATCTVTDADGDIGSATRTITIADSVPVPSFNYTPTLPIEGQSITFTDSSTAYDGVVSWSWNFGDGATSSLQNLVHTYAQQGNYAVTLTVRDADGSTASVTNNVIVSDTIPTAAIAGPTTAVEGINLLFSGFGSAYDSPVTYAWNFGDGGTANGQIVNHIYVQNGVYTITLTVRDNDGSITSATQTINVTDTAPIANAGPDQIINEGVLVTFNGAGSTAYDMPITYSWNFGDGTFGIGVNPTHIYLQNGIYIAVLIVTDSDGSTATDSVIILVQDTNPTAGFTFIPANPNECTSTVQFTSTSTGYDIPLTYLWNFGDGVTSALPNPTHNYHTTAINNPTQTYAVTLILTDADGSINTISQNIIVNDLAPDANAGVDQTVLEGQNVQFNGAGSTTTPGCDTIISYQWSFGDGATGAGINPTHIYSTQGTYTVTLTIIDSDGSIDSDTMTVFVNENNPIVSLIVNQSSGLEPLSTTFTCSLISGGNAPYQFSMSFGNGITDVLPFGILTTTMFTTTYNQDGTYTARCTITDTNGNIGFADQIITVTDTTPIAGFTFIPLTPIENQSIQFTSTSTGYDTPITYFWNFGDGTNSTLQNPTHTYSQQGNYAVTLTVRDGDGDTNSITINIPVTDTVPTAAISALTQEIEGRAVSFVGFGTAYDMPLTYSWNFGDGSPVQSGQTINHIFAQQGTYTVTLIVRDNDGSTTPITHVINILDTTPAIVASATPYPFVQEGQNVQFNGSSSTAYDIPLTYLWNFGDGVTSALPNPTHSYTNNGAYAVMLIIRDNDGSTNSTTLNMVVTDAVPVADFNFNPTNPNEGTVVTFNGGLSTPGYDGIVNYSWNFGDGSPVQSGAVLINPTHTYADNGIYTITLIVRDSDGSTASDTAPIQINDVNPTANAGADQSAQVNSVVQFSGTGIPGAVQDSITSYSWNFGDGSPVQSGASLTNPTHTYTNSGTYTATLTVNDEDSSASDTMIVKVFDIVINEFEQNPVSGSEWVEIYNDGSISMDISGWQIWDMLATPSLRNTIPAGTILAPGQYYTADVVNLNNNPEGLTLRDIAGTLIYDQTPTLSEAVASTSCWARVPNAVDTNTAADWLFQGCTKGVANSADVTAPIISNIIPLTGTTIGSPLTLSANTNENSNCEYSTLSTFVYGTGTDFTTTGNLVHSSVLTLANGNYNYYIKCQDIYGNANVDTNQGTTTFTVNAALPPVNNPPNADAGADQSITIGSSVILNGNLSIDPDVVDILSYSWNINSAPAGSAAILINPLTQNTTFTPDLIGTYVIELVVSDNGAPILSDSDMVVITVSASTVNTAPVANAGSDLAVTTGNLVTLNGSASFDADGDPLTYLWTQISGSIVALSSNVVASPTFTPTVDGSYTFSLVVNDGSVNSAADFVTIVSSIIPPVNNPPNADAGADQNVLVGSLVTLNGSLSNDPDANPITYLWAQISGPAVGLSSNVIISPTFTPIVAGNYVFMLTVQDSGSLTDSDFVTITVNPIGNTAPTLTGIPDQNLALGSGLNNNIIDLWNYAVDAETLDNSLIFGIVSQTASGIVNCAIDSSRYIDCTTIAGTGFSDVSVQVQDAGGLTSSDSFRVNIIGGNLNPTVTITNPGTGSTFVSGTSVNFIGTASDPEDGNLDANIVWSSDIDSPPNIGTGSLVSTTTLSVGTHTITAQVTDSGGAIDTDQIIITISPITGQTIINSNINGNNYPLNFPADVSAAGDGNVAGSSVIDSIINGIANVINSYIYNSNIIAGSVINNCVILSSTFGGICTNSIIDPSNIINSVIDAKSDIKDSTIIDSTITNSNITNSQITGFVINGATITNNLIVGSSGTINSVPVTAGHNINEYKNQAPIVVISASPTSGIDTLLVNFNSAGSSDPNVGGVLSDSLTYSWNFGDGATNALPNPTHTYSVGTFTITLTVTDKFGLSDSDTKTITVTSSTASSGGSSGGGGGGGGASSGCGINLRELTETKTFTTRNSCVISFAYDNIRYEAKIVKVSPTNLTLSLLNNQAIVLLNKENRLSLTSTKDLIFSYDKIDFGVITMTVKVGDKLKINTTPAATITQTTTSITKTNGETTESEENSTPTGAVVITGIRKNAIGVGIMLAIILVGSVVYYVFSRNKY